MVDHFAAIGGIPLLAVFDRPTTIALKWTKDGQVTEWNALFAGVALDLALGIEVCWPSRPEQNAYVERFMGSVRREYLDHVIVCNERGLRRVLNAYMEYYLRSQTHLALDKDAPVSRPVARPSHGGIVAIPQVGGLHHRYERRAA